MPRISSITVEELRELLDDDSLDPKALVVFASDYGDRGSTMQVHELSGNLDEHALEESAYSRSGWALVRSGRGGRRRRGGARGGAGAVMSGALSLAPSQSSLGAVVGALLRAWTELDNDPMSEAVGFHPPVEPLLERLAAGMGWTFEQIAEQLELRGVSRRWVYFSSLGALLPTLRPAEVCAWCKASIREGSAALPVSHGICESCLETANASQAETEALIDAEESRSGTYEEPAEPECDHQWEPAVDETGRQQLEPAFDICVRCGATNP